MDKMQNTEQKAREKTDSSFDERGGRGAMKIAVTAALTMESA
jgi:hypothetical protein